MSKKRRNHTPEFKSKVALAVIKGDKTLTELSKQYGINSNLIVKWKRLFGKIREKDTSLQLLAELQQDSPACEQAAGECVLELRDR